MDDIYNYRRRRFLTKKVHPDWYRRYAKVLNYEDRIYLQPYSEIRHEDKILKSMQPPPTEADKAIALSNKLTEARNARIKLVLKILEGSTSNLDLSGLKPTNRETPLTQLLHKEEGQKQVLFWRQRAVRPPGYVLSPKSKWRLFWENPLFMAKFARRVKQQKSLKIRAKWRKAVRIIECVNRFTSDLAMVAQTNPDFRKLQDAMGSVAEGGDDFNKNHFKAASVGKNLDVNTIFALSKPLYYRTEIEAHMAARALRVMPIFAEFPVYLQDKICEIAWYLELEKDKMIIRQGHVADSFYFLLSGKVAAIKYIPSTSQAKVLAVYTNGAMLGIEGLSSLEARNYTLCTVETCKVIAVNISEYHTTCLQNALDANPEHITFLSQMAFMKFFPMQKLVEDAYINVSLFYFQAGIVLNSNMPTSDFVFVVFKGSCKVLAQISPRSRASNTRNYFLPPLDGEGSPQTGGIENPLRIPSFVISNQDRRQSNNSLKVITSKASTKGRHSRGSGRDNDGRRFESITKNWGKRTFASVIQKSTTEDRDMNINLINAASVEKLVTTKSGQTPHNDRCCPEWVQLKILREGDVIGLENLDLGDAKEVRPARLAVVSEGAEVILILKSFIDENMTPYMKMDLRTMGLNFPDENQLRVELDRRNAWKRYQNKIMEDMICNKFKK